MSHLSNIFSTRELAIFIWAIFVILLLALNREIRKSMWAVVKSFFVKQIFTAFVLMVAYVSTVVYVLAQVGLWDLSLIKDSVFWFFTAGLVTFFKINNADDLGFFKDIILDSVKLIVIVEFLLNFYTFSLGTELALVPLMLFISLLYGYSSAYQKYELATKFFGKLLSLIGAVLFAYVSYKTMVEFTKVFTIQNLKSLLHPIIMTALFMPFAYTLALVMKYEVLFVRIQFLGTDEAIRKEIKREILRQVRLNINKLNRVSKNLTRYGFSPDDAKALVSKMAEYESA